ncbi:MAG: inner rane transporter permease protein yddQ [Firmicutes bacterium]|nr:inner rane transporter permease protein yddQ [Bacillota bacterium]
MAAWNQVEGGKGPDWRRRLRLLRRPVTAIGLALLLLMIVLAVLAPVLATHDPLAPDMGHFLAGPSAAHWFGTDDLGRDIFSRTLYGARVSLLSALALVMIAAALGTLLGALAGYLGGWVDDLIMRLTDMFLAFPGLILAMAIAATLGPGLFHALIALSLVWWPSYARLVRGQFLTLRSVEYVEAARALGSPTRRIMWREILPNAMTPLVVQITLDLGYAILSTSGLSFIGLGVQAPTPEWGAMIAYGRSYMMNAWWYSTFPGLAIFVTVLGVNLLGDGIRDWLDPRHRR